MLWLIFDFENWLLEDPARLADFRIAVLVFAIFVVMASAIAYLWYENRKKDLLLEEQEDLIDYYYNEDLVK